MNHKVIKPALKALKHLFSYNYELTHDHFTLTFTPKMPMPKLELTTPQQRVYNKLCSEGLYTHYAQAIAPHISTKQIYKLLEAKRSPNPKKKIHNLPAYLYKVFNHHLTTEC